MYKHYFHFQEQPFSIAPDPHFMYMSERHQEGLAHLLYGINSGGGFVALTGEVGTGKTTLCHCLLNQLPDDVDIALILNPKLNSLELLANICDELGIVYDQDKTSLKGFTDLLNAYLLSAHAEGRRTVVMIDEAQNLSLAVLEQIRLLTNLETSKAKLLQIVLVGQPELKQLLDRKELRQLKQRITARYHLEPLSLPESRIYIKHRLTISGGDREIFTDRAIRRIYSLSEGVPRLINILCDRALLGAYALSVKRVTEQIVKKAAAEVLDQKKTTPRVWQGAVLLLLCVIIVAVFFKTYPPPVVTSLYNRLLHAGMVIKQPARIIEPVIATAEQSSQEMKAVVLSSETEKKDLEFSALLQNNAALNLSNALQQALLLWQLPVQNDTAVNCQYAESLGYRCLLEQATLNEVLSLNRPVILEFSLMDQQKSYLLLTGLHRGAPVFQSLQQYHFPLQEVLKYWQGYFLLVWKSPLNDGMQAIYPQQYSNNVLWLRQQLDLIDAVHANDTPQERFFDTQLEQRVKTFQRLQYLSQDGIVGSKTIIHLQNAVPGNIHPKLKHID